MDTYNRIYRFVKEFEHKECMPVFTGHLFINTYDNGVLDVENLGPDRKAAIIYDEEELSEYLKSVNLDFIVVMQNDMIMDLITKKSENSRIAIAIKEGW